MNLLTYRLSTNLSLVWPSIIANRSSLVLCHVLRSFIVPMLLASGVILGIWSSPLIGLEGYSVRFEGPINTEAEQLLRSNSQMVALEKNPPATVAALRRRAEADIPLFAKVLQSMAYYDVAVDVHIDLQGDMAQVLYTVRPGTLFRLDSFVYHFSPQLAADACRPIKLPELEIELGAVAYPKNILKAEELLLKAVNRRGYPLARIIDRKVTADVATHTVKVAISLDPGSRAFFGATKIIGNKRVASSFFAKKIAWRQGDLFDPELLEMTQHAMEASALFSSLTITPAAAVEADQSLPITIEVIESKHRSLGAGFGFSTLYGPGALAEYENRNMRQRGERLTFKTTLWRNSHRGILFYLMPDWFYREQDLLWLAQARHEITKSYTETSLSASVAVEQKISDRLRVSYGLMLELLRNTNSDNDGDFNLIKFPVSIRWVAVDDILDPKSGYALSYRGTPTLQALHNRFAYWTNIFIATAYLPVDKDSNHILAIKCTTGSIIGATRRTIPPSERFYAGSEETLRGYRYRTVSPLDRDHDPIGGRSIMVYNLEWRWRMSQQIGWVFFYDIGNVYTSYLPQIYHPQRQATGLGLRFHTPVGPLRLDVAFPLNRRRHLDHRFEIYLSMGQTF